MDVFVSGGAGYIGSAAAEMLLQAGHRVTVYDSLVKGHRSAVPTEADFVQADLADLGQLRAALAARPFDAVLHFAAFIEAGESMRAPGKYFQNNLAHSLGLIEACVQAGVPRFVFSSSAAVYASSDERLSEASPIGPSNVYGQTKWMIEQALAWYARLGSLRYAALRYFNAAGAIAGHGEAHQPETHLIPLVLQAALGLREQVHIYGTDYPTPDGTCIRDYIHIADLVSAHMLALDALEQENVLTFNLGNGAGYSVREVIQSARKVTGVEIPTIEAPRRSGDAPRLVADASKIYNELGWKPEHPGLEEIIASAWTWLQDRPRGYED
jgi:UDP-glucose 4-epimerase